MSLKIVIICAFFLMALSVASAESVSLPLNSVKKPANDLTYSNGQGIDAGQAAALARKGEDLSLLNPEDNKFWQNKKYSAQDTSELAYPQGKTGVRFLSEEAVLPSIFTYMSLVQSAENPNVYFRLSLSRYAHSTLMRAAFLRKLGYYVPSPKYYKNLRLTFASEAQKEEFITNAEKSMIVDIDDRGWIIENNKENHSVVFSDAVLETTSNDYFDLYWASAPNPNNPAQLPIVQRYSRFRAYRALIIPFAMVDLPESVNRFSPKFASVLSSHVVINHPAAESFSACTYEDAKWLVRRLQQFTRQDFEEVVKAGAFPPELNDLIVTKLLYRANNAFEIFGLENRNLGRLPSLDINSPSGLVKNGKVTRERVEGYPQRFAHGERESPFQDGDLERYFAIRGKSMGIGTILNHINKKLELWNMSDAYAKRGTTIQTRIMDHIRKKPFEPLYQDVEAWGGPLGGFNIGATRSVSTGTYYGSSAAIQLVDNVTIAAQLGYFMTLDGVPKISPMAGANVMVNRDYTHVRPLMSIKEGDKVSWKDMVIPLFMNKLSGLLDNEKTKDKKDSVDAFLAELRDGEVFTITDSVALSTYAQVGSSFDTLMGITPLNFMNTVSLGADASRVILRQTSFMRTSEGIQVFVRAQKSSILGMSLDVNYFINLLRVRASMNISELRTDAFVIDYNPELSEMIDAKADSKFAKDFAQTKKSLRPTLHALFKSNDTELLYSKFPHKKFEVDHKLKTKELRSKLLASRVNSLDEEHLLKIRYPRDPEAPELNPKDEEVILFAKKRGELVGRDILGFAFDWIEGILNKWAGNSKVALNNAQDPNPANSPFGKAYWRMVTTESDLSVNNTQYPSVAVLQHVWGGWHLNRKDFLKLLDEVQGQLQGTKLSSYRLIEPEAFSTVSSIDFYRVTASLSVLPGGLEKVRDLLLQPGAAGKPVPKAQFLGRLFQKLSEKLGSGKARPQDKEMYNDLMRIFGNGNLKAGQAKYNYDCREYYRNRSGDAQSYEQTGFWWNGTNYECLTPWVTELLDLSAKYPKDKQAQTRWLTDVLYVLDKQIPLPQMLKLLGEENYVFVVRINGFRTGDEDGDLEYFSNTLGDPRQNLEYANGLIQMFATKTRISPIELDRTQGGFR
ncbi:hypothetical protein D3C87_123580 [compost metagenome]